MAADVGEECDPGSGVELMGWIRFGIKSSKDETKSVEADDESVEWCCWRRVDKFSSTAGNLCFRRL